MTSISSARPIVGVLLLLLAACVVATSATSSRHRLQHLLASEAGWNHHADLCTLGSKVDCSDVTMRVQFALKHRNIDWLERTFIAVSDPDSPSYGGFLTAHDVADNIAPSHTSIATVRHWLESHGASEIELVSARDVLSATVTVAAARRLFGIDHFHVYQHKLGQRSIIRAARTHDVARAYTLPSHIDVLVDMVHGVDDFPPMPRDSMFKKQQHLKETMIARSRSTQVVDHATAAAAAAPAQMTIPMIFPLVEEVQVTIMPVCANGVNVTNATSPCAEQGNAIDFISVYLNTTEQRQFSDGYNTSPYFKTLSFANGANPNCTLSPSGDFTCQVIVKVPLYATLTACANILFSNRSEGGGAYNYTVYYPYTIVSVPDVTTRDLASLYNVPQGYAITNATMAVSQCVVEFEAQYYSPADLSVFFELMGLEQQVPTVVGYNNASNPGGEAALDIEWIMGVAPGAPTYFWSIFANNTVEIDHILTWAYQVGNYSEGTRPLVNSLSYGMSENNVEAYLGQGYLARSDIEFQKLALYGLTIIIACGDAGAGDLGAPPMSNPTCAVLHPDWPSQSPYVTAVGSTYMTPRSQPICYLKKSEGGVDCIDSNPVGEVTVSVDNGLFWTTGGGFSNTAGQAYYQIDQVEAYLNNTDIPFPPSAAFNASGRAYPDVVTVGHNLEIVWGGQIMPIDGTSASAPIFGGLVTLLNNERQKGNSPALGFVNPLLYKLSATYPEAFTDVVVGTNRCGDIGFDPTCCEWGFTAAPGWDAASGLGSPNFQALAQLI